MDKVGELKVGDGATLCLYSDRKAGTVLRTSKGSITIQLDRATLLNGADSGEPDALKFDMGGFCAHVTGVQRYAYERNPSGQVIVFRLRKSGKWVSNRGSLIAGRHNHYNYNF